MKKNIRMIALDMDGTLLHNHGTLSKEGKDALKQLRAKGIRVVIASGRPFYSISRILPDTLFDYGASANGQFIYDNHGNKTIVNPIEMPNCEVEAEDQANEADDGSTIETTVNPVTSE